MTTRTVHETDMQDMGLLPAYLAGGGETAVKNSRDVSDLAPLPCANFARKVLVARNGVGVKWLPVSALSPSRRSKRNIDLTRLEKK